eukprot:9959364-Karenia_brevis.AAC.1
MANNSLHIPRLSPRSKHFRKRIGRLKDGKAVRRSTHATNNRSPEVKRMWIKAMSTVIASMQPQLL